MKKILIVDDDAHIREMMTFALEKAGMQALEAKNGKEALLAFNNFAPDLIVLDITMPEMDGLEVCRQIRKSSEIPILFLSSRNDEIDRVLGLELGADDYVSKPFSPRELIARINAILKRTNQNTYKEENKINLAFGFVKLDLEKHLAYWKNENILLTATEFAILKIVLEHPGRVYTRESITQHFHTFTEFVSDRTIDSHIRRIRNKYAEAGANDIIQTVRGIGYKLGSCQ